VEVVGSTRARDAINVVSSTNGLVAGIYFNAGDQVTAGQVLVELDSASERAEVLETEAALANSRVQLKRQRQLSSRNLSSAAEADDLAAQVSVNEARLASVRSRFEKRFIRAPFPGVVGLRNVSVGDYVDSETVLTTLDDLSVVELDFEVPEKFYGAVKRDQPINASSVAFPARQFAGTVSDIDTRINAATRSFRVRAELPNPNAVLPGGLFMTARLVIVERQDVLLIPQEARIAEGDEQYVFIVKDKIAKRTPVRTGLRTGDDIEVTDGLAVGDHVVTKGHQKLRDESLVQFATPTSKSPIAGGSSPKAQTDTPSS
jgi:membrane fusion protein (multidrug efflux system)